MGTTEKKEEEMIEVILRLPRRDEHERLVQWRNESRQWFFKPKTITLISHLKWYEGIRQDKNQTFYIIEADGIPVGTISLTLRGDRIAEYGRFLIAEAYRHKGYGKAALKALCEDAFERLGIKQIYGDVLNYNEAAIALVEGLGFRRDEEYQMMIYQGDRYWRVIRMAIHDTAFNTE